MTAPTIRAELANAVRRVNAAYHRLPESARPDVRWDGWDDALDAALLSDDRDKALAAIEAWCDHHMALIEGAAR